MRRRRSRHWRSCQGADGREAGAVRGRCRANVLPAGAQLGVLEAMKMEHLLHAPGRARGGAAGRARRLPGRGPVAGRLEAVDAQAVAAEAQAAGRPRRDPPRPAEGDRPPRADARRQPRRRGRASARPQGGRTARANIAAPVRAGEDPATSPSTARSPIAAQTRRRTLEDLIANTPADGMVTGIGSINAKQFGPEKSRCVVHGLRLHGAGRHAGHAQPPQDRPHAGHRAPAQAAGGAVRRRRRRAARRHRHAHRRGPQQPHLQPVRGAVGQGAGGGHRAWPLLRRQRGAAGLRRRDHRHRGQQHRHERPRDDRGRRPRHASRPSRSGRAACSRAMA